ncbi:MAG: hypothetical protein ACRYG4_05150 [Janthinobacterium lividum]
MAMVSSQLLLDVYGCSHDATRWRPVLDGLCRELDVCSAVVQVFEKQTDVLSECWTARDSTSLAHAARHDAFINNPANPRLDRRLAGPIRSGGILRDSDHFPARSGAMAQLRTQLRAAGLGNAVGTGFNVSSRRTFTLMLHRASGDPRPFDEADESFLKELAPHLEQASRLSGEFGRVRSTEAALGSALGRLSTGVVLCDLDRRVRWINPAAEAVLAGSGDIRIVRDRLRCDDDADDRAVARLVATTAGGGPGEARVVAIGLHGSPVQVMAVPLATPMGPDGDEPDLVALILCRPGEVPPVAAAEVAELFGLSPAEARLTVALYGGASVNDYASSRGISVGTARVQLKQVLGKTQTRRQSELVRQICASVVARALR